MPPSHHRGTAAEQGAALRQSMISKNTTPSHSKNPSVADAQPSNPADALPEKGQEPSAAYSVQPTAGSALSNKTTPRLDSEARSGSDKTVAPAQGEPKKKETKKFKRSPFNMPRIQSLTGIDNLALSLEDEAYHPACYSVYLFKSDLDRETVEHFFEKLVELFPKYRYKVELDPAQAAKLDKAAQKQYANENEEGHHASAEAAWKQREEHPDQGRKTHWAKGIKAGELFRPAKWRILEDFDVRENIEEKTLSAPNNGEEALFKAAGIFLGRHFNYAKPLWEALLLHGLETPDGSQSALMIKIHHVVSDGQGLIQSYGVALSAIKEGATREEIQRRFEKSPEKKPGQRGVKPTAWGTIKHGYKTMRGLYLRSRKSFLYGPNTPTKRVQGRNYAHSRGLEMDDIKLIRQAFSTDKNKLTLNDVACALLGKSMGIAARRVAPDGKVKDKRIAIFIPISLRPKGNYELANLTTGAIAWFRMDENMDLEERLDQANREMMRIKKSVLPRIWYNSFDVICKRRIFYGPHYPVLSEIFQKAYRQVSVIGMD